MVNLDHVVFNARDHVDEVAALFDRLGFTVGPRGYHSLGSINHTVVFGDDYLEILGYPPGTPPASRPELVESPVGLMATVLRSADADATRGELLAAGFAPRPVQEFSRPVALPDGSGAEAAFRVTRLEPDAVEGTWFYFCQHLTPELVWRPQWQRHANGALGMCAIDIDVADPAAVAPAYRTCTGTNPLPPEASSTLPIRVAMPGVEIRLHRATNVSGMTGLSFAVHSLDDVVALFRRAGIAFVSRESLLQADPAATYGVKLQFDVRAR